MSLRSEGMPRFLPDCSHGMQSQVFKKFCLTLNTTVLHDTVGSPCKYNKYHKASILYSLQIRVEFACNTIQNSIVCAGKKLDPNFQM